MPQMRYRSTVPCAKVKGPPEASNDDIKARPGLCLCAPALLHEVQVLLMHAEAAALQLVRAGHFGPGLTIHHFNHHLQPSEHTDHARHI